MIIVWDEPKRLRNIDKHGLDFADAEDGFLWADAVELPARETTSGRRRHRLVAPMASGPLVTIVVSTLGTEALSIVSMRPSSSKERMLYAEWKA